MAKANVSSASTSGVSKPPASYEAALTELEALVSRLESGDMPLAQLLTGYQRGAELLAFCRDQLHAVENQIKVLDEGSLKTWTPE
jgi:exodeoxyribonuclease VII small subunit